jgi:AcrR family transcriptional regulator
MRQRTQAGDETRERIVSAALRLFADKGFAAVGIREIAREAGLSSATLYHYMGSKADLLHEIMTDRLRRLLSVASQSLAGLRSPEDKLVTLVRVHVLVHALHPDQVVDHQLRDLRDEPRKSVIALRDEYEALWHQVLVAGLTPPAVFHVAAPKLARLALLEMCNGVAHWYSGQGEFSPEQIADHYAALALNLVAAQRQGRPVRLGDTHGVPLARLVALLGETYPP